MRRRTQGMHMIRLTTTLLLGTLLAGCGPHNPTAGGRIGAARDVPADARVVAEGVPPVSFAFTGGGTVYVYDQTSDSLLHTAKIPGGGGVVGIIVVDPQKRALVARGAAHVEGNNPEEIMLASPIDPKHRFTIWYSDGDEDDGGSDEIMNRAEEEQKHELPLGVPAHNDGAGPGPATAPAPGGGS